MTYHSKSSITKEYPDLDCVFLNSGKYDACQRLIRCGSDNCTGIQRGFDFTKPESIDLKVFENEILTNYTSFVYLTTAFLPFLLGKKEETSIV